MAANKMYKEHPVYIANKDDNYDVHIGIIGFGDFGQSSLIQGLICQFYRRIQKYV